MNHGVTLVAALSLILLGCGGGDDDDAGGADSASNEDAAGSAGSDWCQTILDIEDDLDRLEEDIDNEDFYDEVAEAYRRIADGAPGGLDDDFDRVIAGFEAFNEWLQDPSGDYPLSDAEEAEYTASIDRINAALEQECGIDIDDSDDFDDSGDDAFGDDEFADDEFADDEFADDEFADDEFADDEFDDVVFADDEFADDEFDTESGEGITTQIENDEGSGTVTIGGELPEGFPLPTPETFRVGSSSVMEGAETTRYSAVLHVPSEDFDPTLELYERFLDDEGFEMTKDDISSSEIDRFVFLTGSREQVVVEIVMSMNEVGNDGDGNLIYETTITLSWNEDV